jgi:hypothetical protein
MVYDAPRPAETAHTAWCSRATTPPARRRRRTLPARGVLQRRCRQHRISSDEMAQRLRHGPARRGRSLDSEGLAQPGTPARRWRRAELRLGEGGREEEVAAAAASTARHVGWGSGLRWVWSFLLYTGLTGLIFNPLANMGRFHGCICV